MKTFNNKFLKDNLYYKLHTIKYTNYITLGYFYDFIYENKSLFITINYNYMYDYNYKYNYNYFDIYNKIDKKIYMNNNTFLFFLIKNDLLSINSILLNVSNLLENKVNELDIKYDLIIKNLESWINLITKIGRMDLFIAQNKFKADKDVIQIINLKTAEYANLRILIDACKHDYNSFIDSYNILIEELYKNEYYLNNVSILNYSYINQLLLNKSAEYYVDKNDADLSNLLNIYQEQFDNILYLIKDINFKRDLFYETYLVKCKGTNLYNVLDILEKNDKI